MGGFGSGGHNRLSEEERRRRGTYKAGRSEEDYDQRAAEKVVAGPWLSDIPEPVLPLTEVGRKKYDEFARMLFEQGKLTLVTQTLAEQAAMLYGEMHRRLSSGEKIPTSLSDRMQRALAGLRIAENAKVIADPGRRNKFEGSGFSNRRNSEVRLLGPAKTGS